MVELSIIIPVYNVEAYLNDCFDSLLNQSYRNFEIIVVDDGSTDNSLEICDHYAQRDNRICVVHKVNGGVSSARNVALGLAKGKYLTFVDPDDFVDSETYKWNMEYLNTHCDIDVLQFPYCDYYSATRIENHIIPSMVIVGKHDLVKNWWSGALISFSIWNKIFKRHIFENVTFKEGHVSEDTQLIPTFCDRVSSLYISQNGMYFYRQRQSSYTSHYSFSKHIDLFDAHYSIYGMFSLYPDLYNEKVIAFTRMFRRLIIAKRENPESDIKTQIQLLTNSFPSWKELIKSKGTEKRFLGTAKLLGVKCFLNLDIMWLNYKNDNIV